MSKTSKKRKSCQESIIESLCYLYQEALKENLTDIAYIIQEAIDDSTRYLDSDVLQSKTCESVLKQFRVLCQFQKLNDTQKDLFIRQIECLQFADRKH